MLIDDPDVVSQLSLLLNVCIAMALGGLIGLEREMANRPAGFRTHMLIAGGCALIVGVGPEMLEHFEKFTGSTVLASDPYRIFEAVVTAIAFLGAGTIIQHGNSQRVKGLTTAGALLISGGVGIATAIHLWYVAIGLTVLALMSLTVLNVFERWIRGKIGPSENKSGENTN